LVTVEITPNPSTEEAAAIAAVVVTIVAEEQSGAGSESDDATLHLWLDASRRAAQRAGLQRGPWRLSGRISRRSRA
jgi:hypothetical protein